MDGERDDPDDDVTIVGDHELVVELRRIAASRPDAVGRALPPPVLPAAPTGRRAGRAAARRPQPAAPRPAPVRTERDDWWDDGDDGPRVAWLVLAIVVAAAVVAGLILLR